MLSIRTARRAAALVSVGVVTLAPVPAALATSAGDQQYVDPLNNSPSAPPSGSGSGSGSGSSGASTPVASGSSGSSGSGSSGSGVTSSAPATGTSAASGRTGTTTGKTLPFTGYDDGLAVVLGAGLIGGGLLLRRRLADER